MMKRKKWTEEEEETLINKYSELLNSGSLAKLKTRQKKFEPIADHLNAVHHLRDPATFPFRWTWRDVSVKIQNMRHQYLGVKQKIKLPAGNFNWSDAENHWSNFLKYKHVFGDHDLDVRDASNTKDFPSNGRNDNNNGNPDEDDTVFDFVGEDVLGLGFYEEEEEAEEEEDDEKDDDAVKRPKKGILRKRQREVDELGEREGNWVRREYERRLQLEREIDEERLRRMEMEERREEEEMEWRAQMMGMQMEHEKQMMQMYADSCHHQLQILGVLVRLVCQFFGGGGDGLGGGIGGGLPGQVLQHPGGLVGDNGKGDGNSGPHYM
ncbi:hypothetical protein H6P81_013265 [Aristolochia fimbriata]|uniref:Uncharacterized protein n=1 Tax=Aristolochia fimbriata TaxID=158543 RepID=A0AAV7EHH6_ARIFI|nr:hypothetical protein H6P81_013265 [Aristolochia fimbriata]